MKKFRKKNWGLETTIKLVATWYMCVFFVSFLTSNSSAYFNDSDQVTGIFQVGTWETPPYEWDKSSLKFNEGDQVIESCGPTDISVVITNTGNDMTISSNYKVYYAETGNPRNGIVVGEGVISPIKSRESLTLNFHADKTGYYKFQAFQLPGHGNSTEIQDLWSGTITVRCSTDTNDINNSNETTNTDEIKESIEESSQAEEPSDNLVEEPQENAEPFNETDEAIGDDDNLTGTNDESEALIDRNSETGIEEGNENAIY